MFIKPVHETGEPSFLDINPGNPDMVVPDDVNTVPVDHVDEGQPLLPEVAPAKKLGLKGIQREYSKATAEELESIKRDLLDGEFFNVIAKRYGRSLSNIQYWAKKWQIPSHPDRLKKTVAGHVRKAQKLAVAEAKEAHKLDPGTAQGVLWTILLDKGQPASARVSAFEKLHTVAGWGVAGDQVLPEPSTPDELVQRVTAYLTSLHPKILARVLRTLQETDSHGSVAPELQEESEETESTLHTECLPGTEQSGQSE